MCTRRNFISVCTTSLSALPILGQTRPGGMSSRHVAPRPSGLHSSVPFRGRFTEISAAAGLREPSICGHPDHVDYIVEAMGCGVAFLDLDNDGWLDVLVLSG